MDFPLVCVLSILCVTVLTPSAAAFAEADTDEEVTKLLRQSTLAAQSGDIETAITLASDAITRFPKSTDAYDLRARLHAAKEEYRKSISDFSQVIKLNPKSPDAYDRRGDQYFKMGKFKEAIADYDRFLAFRPTFEPRHWRRGIAYYYAAKYVKGQKQFEGYQTFDSNDVENAVWRYLCMARHSDVKKARSTILKIGDDRRVPMRQVYELFAGNLKPDDVLNAAKAGDPPPDALNRRLFYAHLYLGLFYEVEKNVDLANKHIGLAAKEHRIGHFMWDVARVHAEVLRTTTRDLKKSDR